MNNPIFFGPLVQFLSPYFAVQVGLGAAEERMKPSTFAAFVALSLWLLPFIAIDAQARAPYSLKDVEANPIPKAEHFRLWREVALKACMESKTRFNLSESECITVISKRADACILQLSNQSPVLISTTAAARDVGRKYMHCATPFYFCNGIEVKSEDEARAKCK